MTRQTTNLRRRQLTREKTKAMRATTETTMTTTLKAIPIPPTTLTHLAPTAMMMKIPRKPGKLRSLPSKIERRPRKTLRRPLLRLPKPSKRQLTKLV